MNDLTSKELLLRVLRLERKSAWWRRSFIAFAGVVGISTFVGARRAEDTKVLEAERFVLRDRDQRVRAVLGIEADNSVKLSLNGKDGECRLGFIVDLSGQQAHLAIADAQGNDRIALGVLPDQSASQLFLDGNGGTCIEVNAEINHVEGITAFDRNGKHRLAFGLADAGSPEMTLYDRQGFRRLSLDVGQEDDRPSIVLDGKLGKSRMNMEVKPDGSMGLLFTDSHEKSRLLMGLAPNDSAVVLLNDQEAKTKIGLAAEGGGGAVFEVIGKDGKPVFSTARK